MLIQRQINYTVMYTKVLDLILSMDVETPENTTTDYKNCNTEVIVIIEEPISIKESISVKYVASFFTYRYIDTIIKKHKTTGEYLSGQFFHANNMVLIESCNKSKIKKVVHHLLDEGEFYQVFRKI